MVGRIAIVAVVAVLGLHVALSASGQDEAPPVVRRPPTLAESLQRVRQELLGEPRPRQSAAANGEFRRPFARPRPAAIAQDGVMDERVVEGMEVQPSRSGAQME